MRCHKLPSFKCPRCYEAFEDVDRLTAHSRSEVVCLVKREPAELPNPIMGYNEKQKQELDKRFKTTNSVEKWNTWYCILFYLNPETDELPTPCKDNLQVRQKTPQRSCC